MKENFSPRTENQEVLIRQPDGSVPQTEPWRLKSKSLAVEYCDPESRLVAEPSGRAVRLSDVS